MSKNISNLRDLFLAQGRELYDATRQEIKELPEIKKKVTNTKLRGIIDRQLSETKAQETKLNKAFESLKEDPKGETSECCKSVLNKTSDLIKRAQSDAARDAIIINGIQRLNHNKIAGIGSLVAYADQIEQKQIADSLHKNLKAEKELDKDLSKLAISEVNQDAMKPRAFA